MSLQVESPVQDNRVQAPIPSSGAERYHALDAVRAFALLLGVVFHAAESFEPNAASYWAIMDRAPSLALSVFRHACHSFRLELFFLIAGFFARLLYERRGPREFIRNRVSRILVPLVIGWVVLYPVCVYLWLLGSSLSGRLPMFGVPSEFAHLPAWQLTIGFFASFRFVEKFDLTHLWFLHQLLVLYALMLIARAFWSRLGPRRAALEARVDRGFARLVAARGRTVALALITAPVLTLMRSWNVDTPKESLLPHLPTTLLFGFLFGIGWLLHRQPALIECFRQRWRGNLLLGLLMVWPTEFAGRWLHSLGVERLDAPWVRWLHAAWYALMMWGFMLGFLGLFARFCRTPSARWRYVADASYWIYLVHLPLVVWLQIQVASWPPPWPVKLAVILAVAVPLLFLSYDFLVRSTFIGRQLNGHRYPRHFSGPLWPAAALIVLGFAVPLIWQHRALVAIRKENLALQAQAALATRFQEENSSLRARPVDPAEARRRQQEQAELLRLRAEVARLRGEARAGAGPRVQPLPADESTPPTSMALRTFSASTRATLSPGQALLTGGWATRDGKRTLMVLSPTIEKSDTGPSSVMVQSYVVEVPDSVLAELLPEVLQQVNADHDATSFARSLSAEQLSALMQQFRETKGVDFLSVPRVLTADGRQARVSMGEAVSVGGELQHLGPSLDIVPSIAADGSAVDLAVEAKVRLRASGTADAAVESDPLPER
jgi:glucans biosynthesis protein C